MPFNLPFLPPIPSPDVISGFLRRTARSGSRIPGTPYPEGGWPNPRTNTIPGRAVPIPGVSGTISGGRPTSSRSLPGFPSTADILTRLAELQDPGRYMADQSLLEQQARSQSSMQYDPIIEQLRNQMGLAKQRGESNKAELGRMFGSLSESLMGDIPGVQSQFAGTKGDTAQIYSDLESRLSNQYAESQAQQEELFKRLGIEAAMGETAPQQARDRDFFVNLARAEGQTQQAALGQEERGAVEFTRRGSEIARTEGTQRQADLMSQLEALLSQYESQIGANEAAKQTAYSGSLAQLQQQMGESAQSRAQRDFENYLASINLGRSLRNDELDQAQILAKLSQQQRSPVQSISDIPQSLLGLGLEPNSAQRVQGVLMSTLLSEQLRNQADQYGGTISKEELAARVREAGQQAGLSEQELNALYMVATEYFGRR